MIKHLAVVVAAQALCLMAAAASAQDGNPATGKRVFGRCIACHTLEEGAHRVGPSLHGLWGRQAGTVEGFRGYSDAMIDSGIVWSPETLDAYIADVAGYLPGGKMAFAGLPNATHRAHLLAYLTQELGEPPTE